MGFKIKTKREFEILHTHEEDGTKYDFKIKVKLQAGEDVDYNELRHKLENVSDEKIINEETGDEIDNSTYNAFLYSLRTSIIEQTGFMDENEEDIKIIEDGKINKINQIAVFEAIRMMTDFFDKLVTAYTGLDAKN